MPGLLSGSTLRKGGSGQFIKLSDAMPQLPASPSTSTGYTIITSDKLVTTYATSLGNIQFTTGTMYVNVTGTNLKLIGTDTLSVIVSGGSISTNTNTGALVVEGGIGVWGDAYIGGNLFASSATMYSLNITSAGSSYDTISGAITVVGGVGIGENLNVRQFLNVGSTATFKADVNIKGNVDVKGAFAVDGNGSVDISPVAATVYIEPTLGGSVTIQPSAEGHMNNMIIGEYQPKEAHFLNAYADNFIGLATTSTNIAGGTLGSIPYQTSTGTTDFIGIGPSRTVLTSNGTTATWASAADLSVNTATNADNVFINQVDDTLLTDHYVILSTATNQYGKLAEDSSLTYNADFREFKVTTVKATASVYSREGNPNESNLLYVPISTLSIGVPPANPRLGDFWIDPGQGATFQYMLDGSNRVWVQFTGL